MLFDEQNAQMGHGTHGNVRRGKHVRKSVVVTTFNSLFPCYYDEHSHDMTLLTRKREHYEIYPD